MIKFLRDCSVQCGFLKRCGDGCCSWMEYDSRQVKAGDVFDEFYVQLDGLFEDIDYVYVPNPIDAYYNEY